MSKNIWLDGIMGVAVGDALGLPVQFESRHNIAKDPVVGMRPCNLFDSPIGTWSDDTAMTLAMLDSICNLGTIDAEDIMKRFVSWLFEDKYSAHNESIDVGNTCYHSIKSYRDGVDIYHCGSTGEYANGNGSLMRTLPVCLYYAEMVNNQLVEVDDAIRDIHLVSALTHNHLRACVACGLYFFAVSAILYDEGTFIERLQKGMNRGFEYYRASEYFCNDVGNVDRKDLDYYSRLENLQGLAQADESEIKSSGYVVDSLEAAVWSIITTSSYREAMLRAVNLGDDSDTVAAIAGGLAGLYYGYEGIPEEWLAVIARREWIEELCDK